MNNSALTPLPREFYQRDTVTVAHSLLGHLFVRRFDAGSVVSRIVEVEAYCGPYDLGAHTSGGRRTPRNEAMYGEKGHAYIYLIYGMYHCINAVAGPSHLPQAGLIRSLEIVSGHDLLHERMQNEAGELPPEHTWLRGPGKLCKSLDIDKRFYASDLTNSGPIYIAEGTPIASENILCGPRIGIDYAADWTPVPWRFYEKENRSVSSSMSRNRSGIPLSQLSAFPIPAHES